MKKLILILACSLFLQQLLFAQKTIEVICLKNTVGGYSFYAYNTTKINYVIHLYFTEISNLTSSIRLPYDGEVKPGNNYLFSLTPENSLLATDFKYKYTLSFGSINTKADINYPYLLPFSSGKSSIVKINNLVNHLEDVRFIVDSVSRLVDKHGVNHIVPPKTSYYLDSNVRITVAFKLKYGNTIYAARKGVVNSIYVKARFNTGIDTFLAKIEIYQNDFSIATYQGVHNILIANKQLVEAGDPIAIAGELEDHPQATIRFSVRSYDDSWRFKYDSGYISIPFFYSYINPMFYTKEGGVNFLEDGKTYTAAHPEEIITREMTKKERKIWLKKHL